MGATKVLLAMGAEVNAGDADGMTPLMWASRRGHAEIVRILLEAKALPDVLDNEGLSARIHAELLKPTRTSAGVLAFLPRPVHHQQVKDQKTAGGGKKK